MTKRFGFTLAEVLITLGIIGVVAAMTIPTLIANTNGAKFRSQFKKTLSTLNQAGLMAQAQYDFDYAGAAACGTSDQAKEDPTSSLTFCALLNGTLTGQTYKGKAADIVIKGEEKYKGAASLTPGSGDEYLTYALADGSLVGFSNAAKSGDGVKSCTLGLGETVDQAWITAHANCLGFIDVNGITLPNKEVTCTTGTTSTDVSAACVVQNNASNMTDIFPILFHDATVEPATNAAKYVLTTSK